MEIESTLANPTRISYGRIGNHVPIVEPGEGSSERQISDSSSEDEI